VLDKNREISPLRERGRLRGKGSGEKVSFKTRMEDPVRHADASVNVHGVQKSI